MNELVGPLSHATHGSNLSLTDLNLITGNSTPPNLLVINSIPAGPDSFLRKLTCKNRPMKRMFFSCRHKNFTNFTANTKSRNLQLQHLQSLNGLQLFITVPKSITPWCPPICQCHTTGCLPKLWLPQPEFCYTTIYQANI